MDTLIKPVLRDMVLADLDQVLSIEQRVHDHPWTRGNFTDAFNSGYVCRIFMSEGDSNSISKVKQGGDERTTKTVQLVRLGVSEDTNAVSPMKWNWNEMLGYAVLMPAVDEAHLLNISIAAEHQRRGLGATLLHEIMNIARSLNMRRVILEVRPSNLAALALYRKAGFGELAMRRSYYPAVNNGREDAMVMEYLL